MVLRIRGEDVNGEMEEKLRGEERVKRVRLIAKYLHGCNGGSI